MNYPVVKNAKIYQNLAAGLPNNVRPLAPKKIEDIGAVLYKSFIKQWVFIIFSLAAPMVVLLSIISLAFGMEVKDFNPIQSAAFIVCLFGLVFTGQSMLEVIVKYGGTLLRYKTLTQSNDLLYQHEYKNYELLLEKWQKLNEDMKDNEFLHKFRVGCVIDNLKAYCKAPVMHPYSERIRKGASEERILNVLKSYFLDKIIINHTVAGLTNRPLIIMSQSEALAYDNENKNELSRYTPLPDFVLHDAKIGYSIVIEIDEPYDLKFGYPIHCVGKDDLRDDYFLKYNWPVLRFAERQFLHNPLECCDYIASYANAITLGLSGFETIGTCQNLLPVKCWTEEEAIKMEISGLRESYLPVELLGNALMGIMYKSYGFEIRRKNREISIIEEIEREDRRVERLNKTTKSSEQHRFLSDDENGLPF